MYKKWMTNLTITRTSLMNPVLPIYFLLTRDGHSLVIHVLALFLKTASKVSSFRE